MSKSWKTTAIVTNIVIVTLCLEAFFVEVRTKIIRRDLDDLIYDNKNHYLPCDKLPTEAEVNQVVQEHQNIVEAIMKVIGIVFIVLAGIGIGAGGTRVLVQFLDKKGEPTLYTFDVFTREQPYWGSAIGYPPRDWVIRDVYPYDQMPLFWPLIYMTQT